jgi:hypothetical protein
METLKRIVSNQYFPAAAVLTAVVLFWAVGMLGGLSLLNNNQPPLTTLTWMLFVYLAAVLTPLAGTLAAVDLVRRWKRNRAVEAAGAFDGQATDTEFVVEDTATTEAVPVQDAPAPQQAPVQQPASAQQAPPAKQPAPAQQRKGPKQPGRKQAA